jgi:hypothetical protein
MLAFGLACVLAWWSAPGRESEAPAEPSVTEVWLSPPDRIRAGFGEADITPHLTARPVYMAGFGHNRKATGVHDPLKARAVVLCQGDQRIALVSIDVVGFFYPDVLKVRSQLGDFEYVLVSSTHNHEGPDTLGLWGPGAFVSGVDPTYMRKIEEGIIAAVRAAQGSACPATVSIGSVKAPDLLHDAREPYVKHDELVALRFMDEAGKRLVGIIVQWNCHPETLGGHNNQISADFVGYTVGQVRERFQCPVVYFTGTVGGLMTSLNVSIKDSHGRLLADGTFEKTETYGRAIGRLAERALATARPVRIAPIQVKRADVFLPLYNPLYKLGRQLGVFHRQGYLWAGDPRHADPAGPDDGGKPLAVRTEVALLHLGELDVAAIPGEIYPELVLDKVQDPADPGADFPDAPIEPALYKQTKGPYRMIIGLANDELGYIIPKRQWDEVAPFCYGRKTAQYGEINSVGPETAPILCEAFRSLARGTK